jgi:hypothetical protein|tara:strand:+ start:521 stop:850 length:330 start_codon:yes stop_codon:yes gene_type:complete
MKLLTKEIKQKLENNRSAGWKEARPIVKFFNPTGKAAWLIGEIEEDGDTMFGLCDLGMGEPALGYVSLRELASVKLGQGLGIERDLYWTADKTMQEYADEARQTGYIQA